MTFNCNVFPSVNVAFDLFNLAVLDAAFDGIGLKKNITPKTNMRTAGNNFFNGITPLPYASIQKH